MSKPVAKISLAQLRALFKEMLRRKRQADIGVTDFNSAMAYFCAENDVPDGYAPDLFGDGKIKPAKECAVFDPNKKV